MPRDKTQKTIEDYEKQIASLMAEVNRLKQKSESMWASVYDMFVEEGNEEGTAEHFSNLISSIILKWAQTQRDRLAVSVASTGFMPPYSECLNNLVVSVTPPGESPVELGEVPVPDKEDVLELPIPRQARIESVPRPSENLSEDAIAGPPKMKRVNVPKGILGAKPLSLLDSSSEGP